jgi:hypothetical protein
MAVFPPLSQPANVGTSIVYEKQRPAFPQRQSTYPRVNLRRSASYVAGQLQTQPRGPRPQIQHPSQHAQQAPQPQPQTAYVQPYAHWQVNPRASCYPQAQPKQVEGPPQPEQTQTPSQHHIWQPPQVQSQPHFRPAHYQPFIQTQPRVQKQSVVQQQQARAQMSHSPVEMHASVQPQPHVQKQTLTGPAFVFDQTATYPHVNTQAWARSYAPGQAGTDPGITDARSPPTAALQLGAGRRQQQQPSSATSFSESGASASALPGHVFAQSRQPNPFGPSSSITNGLGRTAIPASAGPGGPDVGARTPCEKTTATMTTTLPGQFVSFRRNAWARPVSTCDRGDDVYFEPGIQPHTGTTRVFTEAGE